MKNLIYFSAGLLILAACKKEEAQPVACMNNVNADYLVFDEAFFENCSEEATSYTWTVDGPSTNLSYTEQSPQHTWDVPGSFEVTLVASSESGEKTDETSQTVEVADLCFSCIYLGTGPSSEEIICASEEGSMDAVFDRKQEFNDLGYTCTEL